ncbi:PRD domain-containing protein [Vallitaleaceae bacterium 9-2]
MEERLNVLREAGLITENIYEKLNNMIVGYKRTYNIELTEDNASMMITHLSQAMMRVERNEKINEPDQGIVDELMNSEHYAKMEEMYKGTCAMLDFEFPPEEKWFVFVHIGKIIITETIT